MFIVYLINKETFLSSTVLPGSAGNLPVMSTMLGLSCQDGLAVHMNSQQVNATRCAPLLSSLGKPICKNTKLDLDTEPAEQDQYTCSSST